MTVGGWYAALEVEVLHEEARVLVVQPPAPQHALAIKHQKKPQTQHSGSRLRDRSGNAPRHLDNTQRVIKLLILHEQPSLGAPSTMLHLSSGTTRTLRTDQQVCLDGPS
eukprot:1660345-Rhodomonas_salina.2